MAPRPDGGGTRAALARHLALTVLVVAVVCGLVALGVVRAARQEAYRSAERVARQVAAAVVVPLSRFDFGRPVDPVRPELTRELAPLLGSGMVRRVEVWTERAGQAVVLAAPADAEHRFEAPPAAALLEVCLGFRDAGGNPARLEVHVPVDEAGTVWRTAAEVLVPLLGGLVLLAVGTLPLTVRLARRAQRERAEQQAVRRYGLAAAEHSRHELARHLHDGVIPQLAGASLLIEAARGSGLPAGAPSSVALLDHVRDVLAGELRRLRALLDGLLPPTPLDGDLATALTGLAAELRAQVAGEAPGITVDVCLDHELGDDLAVLLHRVAGELVRNALRHAAAEQVRVRVTSSADGTAELVVADDGRGIPADRPAGDGHIGLVLVRRVVRDHGGRLHIRSAPGVGTTVSVSVPGDDRPWQRSGERT
ncbi:sensor histidine kinase [Pseudonocardia humida]|uniref:Oxygen sensor histidine kinase NreB n=1 Tax=Pseudonocardia humida TaxID=2800819 RepID=A0ABT1A222_9PSEU|nr:ATP-binding protein [Pseudonocardia humida]MCO1657055.1 hypothetical protein [Pseudonocardia humida]